VYSNGKTSELGLFILGLFLTFLPDDGRECHVPRFCIGDRAETEKIETPRSNPVKKKDLDQDAAGKSKQTLCSARSEKKT